VNAILENVLGFIIGSGIVVFLVRSWIKHYLDRRIEEYKSVLQVGTAEHLHRFGRIYDKRLDIMASVYGKLRNAHRCFSRLVALHLNINEAELIQLDREAGDAVSSYMDFFSDNELFIPEDLCDSIAKINDQIKEAMAAYNTYKMLPRTGSDCMKYLDKAMKAINGCEPMITALKETVRSRFGQIFTDKSG
jgi:hypothetical protein